MVAARIAIALFPEYLEGKEDKNAPLRNTITCAEDNTDPYVSLAVAPANGRDLHYCTLTAIKDSEGEATALQNGVTYTFMVTSVAGDKYNQISWTSNLIEDTPAIRWFDGNITLKAEQYVRFHIQDATPLAAAPEAVACGSSAPICGLTAANNSGDKGIFIARDIGSRKDRIFISAPAYAAPRANQDIAIQDIGPATHGAYTGFIPGDEATTSLISSGTKFTVLGDQIFDFTVRLNGNIHYGKAVITNLSLEDRTTAASDITLNVIIVLQPAVDNTHYLR